MAAKKVLQDMCFVDVAIQKQLLKKQNLTMIIGSLLSRNRGNAWTVLIGMTEENACAIASKMCMMEVKTIDDFASSAIVELGKHDYGKCGNRILIKGVGIDITPPTLSHGEVSFTNNFA